MAQVVRSSLLVQKVWNSNPEPIKFPKRCQRLVIAVTLKVCAPAQSRRDEHSSLVTPERTLSEYNEDLIFLKYARRSKLSVLLSFIDMFTKTDIKFNDEHIYGCFGNKSSKF